MPSNLTDNYVANTYKGVLHVNGEELPADTKVQVYDGAGNETAIKIGNNGIDCLSLSALGLTANDFKYPDVPGNQFSVLCQTSKNAAGEVNTLELKDIKAVFCESNTGVALYSRASKSAVSIVDIECGIVNRAVDVEVIDITGSAGGIDEDETGNYTIGSVKIDGGIVTRLTLTSASLTHQPNLLINAQGIINQRQIYNNGPIAQDWNPRRYFLDRWRSNNGIPIIWSYNTPNVVTISALGALGVSQTIEKINIIPGIHTLSWRGNAAATIIRHGTSSVIATGSGGTGEIKTITANLDADYDIEIRFTNGTFSLPKFERGSTRTEFDYRNFGSELLLCQRYFCKTSPYVLQPGYGGCYIQSQSIEPWSRVLHNNGWSFPVTLRTTPDAYVMAPGGGGAVNQVLVIKPDGKDNDDQLDRAVVYATPSDVSDGGIGTVYNRGSVLSKGVMRAYFTHYAADAEF